MMSAMTTGGVRACAAKPRLNKLRVKRNLSVHLQVSRFYSAMFMKLRCMIISDADILPDFHVKVCTHLSCFFWDCGLSNFKNRWKSTNVVQLKKNWQKSQIYSAACWYNPMILINNQSEVNFAEIRNRQITIFFLGRITKFSHEKNLSCSTSHCCWNLVLSVRCRYQLLSNQSFSFCSMHRLKVRDS